MNCCLVAIVSHCVNFTGNNAVLWRCKIKSVISRITDKFTIYDYFERLQDDIYTKKKLFSEVKSLIIKYS
jgi:hypothetical protein